MGVVLMMSAALIAILPAGIAIMAGDGVPPQQGTLFGVVELILAGVAGGLVYQNRYKIWLLRSDRLSGILIIAGCTAGALLVGYLLVYNLCVVEHPLYGDKVLFPLWASGKLAEMIQRAGSRYGALEQYGLAAVFDAISEMPGEPYAVAVGTLLLLYALPLAGISSIAFVLALRHPPEFFDSPVAQGEVFDVFLCYNHADKIAVRSITKQLTSQQIRFFFDESENPPGRVWTKRVEQAIAITPCFAIFLGCSGVGRWQEIEIQSISEARVERGCGVIPVFLPDAPLSAKMPMQLAGLTWIDFRKPDPDPIAEFIRGIKTYVGIPNRQARPAGA